MVAEVLVVLGEGGHTAEMVHLLRLLGDRFRYVYVITKEDRVSEGKIPFPGPVHRVNRPRWKGEGWATGLVKYLRLNLQSLALLLRTHPKVVIHSGPGTSAPIAFWGKLLGAKTIYIENGSRVSKPSASSGLAYLTSDIFFIQWPDLRERFPGAIYAGNLYDAFSAPRAGAHGKSIFVTVGTTDFDDLVRSMDQFADEHPEEQVVIQIGDGRYEPMHAEWFRFAPSLDRHYSDAKVVVAHGGIGTTMEVLQRGIPLVSVANPDRDDDHQRDILEHLSRGKHLIWCRDMGKLSEAVERASGGNLRPYVPQRVTVHEIVGPFIQSVLAG